MVRSRNPSEGSSLFEENSIGTLRRVVSMPELRTIQQDRDNEFDFLKEQYSSESEQDDEELEILSSNFVDMDINVEQQRHFGHEEKHTHTDARDQIDRNTVDAANLQPNDIGNSPLFDSKNGLAASDSSSHPNSRSQR